ncbi:S8/S53 family peptidase [Desulfopila sp. IMCC35008]|uniref:S8 family peptidase n=1 Tax=Desulfopila sp. IMCC35008 TaxID=2653858 RepID=UPI0013D883E1|nr:S8/S53 family peptidase [Desulfopila sp. IMCC35008]
MRIFRIAPLLLLTILVVPGMLFSAVDSIIKLEQDKLTLRVTEMPLSLILDSIAQTGIQIKTDPRIDPDITANFSMRPIGRALDSILGPYNHALVWEHQSADDTTLSLVEIQIFEPGKKDRIRALREADNLDVIKGKSGRLLVRDVLLLHLKQDAGKETVEALLNGYNATLLSWNETFGILRILLPEGSDPERISNTLLREATVNHAEPDYAYPLNAPPVTLPGQGLATVPQILPEQIAGSTIAVLDSGFSREYSDSSYLAGSYNALSPESPIDDPVGHGTQMTMIASGAIQPVGVEETTEFTHPVLSIRSFDDNGFTSTYTLLNSIDYAVATGARILSMSWGSEDNSPMLDTAINYAADSGLILVAAAGNSPTGVPVYPAAYDNVIGVGALMPDGSVWNQSNFGDFVAIQAPGLADLPVGYNGAPGLYAGTSISTAFTALMIAEALDKNPEPDMDTLLETISASP